MCYANKNTRDNIKFNIIKNKRYYYKTLNIRINCAHISKSAKKNYFRQYNITIELFALQVLTLALNIISSCSNNLAHSEFASIVKKIVLHFLK